MIVPPPTVTPTPVPTLDLSLKPKDPAEATVYYYDVSVAYHYAPSCKGMNGAPAHTLAEAIADGKHACGNCHMVQPDVVDIENPVWTDEDGRFHLTNDCGKFSGKWKVTTLEKALEDGFEACTACRADEFRDALEYTPVFTAVETVDLPSLAPAEEAVTASVEIVTPKEPGEAIVYYYDVSQCYHYETSCKNMPAGAQAHTLTEAVADGKRRCGNCGTPPASVLEEEQVVWTDRNRHYHLTNTCGEFSGQWYLMPLEDALEEGYTPCSECKADIYTAQTGHALP